MSARAELYHYKDITYDVGKIYNYISAIPESVEIFIVPINENLIHHLSLYKEPDEDLIRLMTVTRMNDPVMAIVNEHGEHQIIDGYHRIMKRHRSGKKDVSVLLIPEPIVNACKTRRTAKF